MIKKMLILTIFYGLTGTTNGAASNEKTLLNTPNLKIIDYTPETIRQEGVDCGLHSTKNARALYLHLSGQIPHVILLDLLKSEAIGRHPHMPACRLAITGSYTSRLLTGDQVERFAQTLDFPMEHLTVLENLDIPHYRQSEKNKLAQLVRKLKTNQPAVHAFVLGNMSERTGSRIDASGKEVATTIGSTGHYIGAVLVKKRGMPIEIHLADSAGERPAANIAISRKLLQLLRGIQPTKLQFEEVDHHYRSAQRYAANNPIATLGYIEQLITSVQEHNLFNRYFINNYQAGIRTLLDIIAPFIPDEETARLVSARDAIISQEHLMYYQAPAMRDVIPEVVPAETDDALIAAISASLQSSKEKEQLEADAQLAHTLAEQEAKTPAPPRTIRPLPPKPTAKKTLQQQQLEADAQLARTLAKQEAKTHAPPRTARPLPPKPTQARKTATKTDLTILRMDLSRLRGLQSQVIRGRKLTIPEQNALKQLQSSSNTGLQRLASSVLRYSARQR